MEAIDVGEEADISHWPQGVRQMTIGDSQFLGVDQAGRLFWDGQPVSVISEKRLGSFERWLASFVAFAAIFGGIGGAAQGVNAWHDFGCKRSWDFAGCANRTAEAPPPSAASLTPIRLEFPWPAVSMP